VTIERATATVAEAATQLGISRNKAYEAVHRGDIPTIRIGKRILVPRAALERMLGTAGNRHPETEAETFVYEATIRLTCDRKISNHWLTQHLRRSAPLITGTVWRGALAGAGAAGDIILMRIGGITRVRR
jgi:excisionase family DNA binding protein